MRSTPVRTSCCAHLFLNDSIFHLNDTACADVFYLKSSEDIDLGIILNGKEIFSDDIPLSDLKKECVGIPYIKKEAEICVDFDKIRINTSYIGACAKIEVDLLRAPILSVDVGCFHFTP